MIEDQISVEVQNVVKTFRIHHEKKNTLVDHLISSIRRNSHSEELVVLDDISFSIRNGEMIGIIGRNGSGKTTLLRLIAKIIRPNKGTIFINGNVVPLLELGTGFQVDLTAYDNIIQYGQILGFGRKEMIQKVDYILKFAGLEKFSDTRIRNFSSGMIARLAFSTAVQVEPEILLVDEVLAVGDLDFQQKSHKAFLKFKENKKTIVYVTHDTESVLRLCDRAILLEKGKIQSIGEPEKVIDDYMTVFDGKQ